MEDTVLESNVKKKYYTIQRWTPGDGSIPVNDVKGTSLFDLSLVKVSWLLPSFIIANIHGVEEFEIHGYIFLLDDQGNEFALFYRDRDNPVKVPLHLALHRNSDVSITLEKLHLECPRVSPGTFCLVFYLKATFGDTLILSANQVKFIDNTTNVVAYDQVCRFEFEIESPFLAIVTVEYTIFQCALVAWVGFIIEKISEDGIDDKYANMTGTICASFEARDGTCFKRVLYSSYYSGHEFENYVELCVFGVPTYSSLFIEPNVIVYGEEFRSTTTLLEFKPCHNFYDAPFEEMLMGQRVRMRMLVKWGHAINYLPEAFLEWRDRTRREVIEDRNWEHGNQNSVKAKADRLIEKCIKRLRCISQKNFQPIPIQPRLEALSNRNWYVSGFHDMLVEVFSISVCSNEKVLATCFSGTINVNHAFGKLRMFNRAHRNPKNLHSFEPIPLKSFDRCIRGPNFCMEIDLKDRQGDEFCRGYVGYNFHTVDEWLNRRLCSTLKGKKGFVTVHHTIFADAVQAKLKFILMSNFDKPIEGRAFGRINGRYGNFRYGTHYEKKFYQTTFFDQDEARPVKIVGSKIPLSKCVVAVPLNGSLVVTAHICVLIQGECETLKYTYEAMFDPVKRRESEILSNKIQGSNFSLSMSVECG